VTIDILLFNGIIIILSYRSVWKLPSSTKLLRSEGSYKEYSLIYGYTVSKIKTIVLPSVDKVRGKLKLHYKCSFNFYLLWTELESIFIIFNNVN